MVNWLGRSCLISVPELKGYWEGLCCFDVMYPNGGKSMLLCMSNYKDLDLFS